LGLEEAAAKHWNGFMGSGTHDGTAEPRAWEINGIDGIWMGWDDGEEASQDDNNHEIFFKLDSTHTLIFRSLSKHSAHTHGNGVSVGNSFNASGDLMDINSYRHIVRLLP
jgi:hypothetical protein